MKEHNGFLKYVCEEQEFGQEFKCINSNIYYRYHGEVAIELLRYTVACPNDPHFYQMCDLRFRGRAGWKITNNEELCEGYLCDAPWARRWKHHSFYQSGT